MFFYDTPAEENLISTSPDTNTISTSFAKAYGDITNSLENDTKIKLIEDETTIDTEQNLENNKNSIIQTNSRILLMGLPRSGKSSIQNVVFHKMAPNETFFLESTTKIVKNEVTNSSFVQFQLWDFPGQSVNSMFDSEKDAEKMFKNCGAIIFVIDAQDNYNRPISKFVASMLKAHSINPNLKYELFIHKVDGLSDDQKIETQTSICNILKDEMHDTQLTDFNIKFYMTSIYDYSIYEAVSKVVQQLIPQLPTLENLLNIFISGSGMEKAFLCDVVSKIYIATDSNPVDLQTYELCCDMIDVVVDLQCIYGMPDDESYCPFDSQSYCTIRLSTNMVLYLREINEYLALVCIVRENNFKREGIIDHNFECLKSAVKELFELERSAKSNLNPELNETNLGTDSGVCNTTATSSPLESSIASSIQASLP